SRERPKSSIGTPISRRRCAKIPRSRRRNPQSRRLHTARRTAQATRTARLATRRSRRRRPELQPHGPANPGQPEATRELLDRGTLRVHIQQRYDLAHAADALQHLAQYTKGKIALAAG